MRVLYITDSLAVWGGIERVLCDKMNYLIEHYGYDVHLVTIDQGDHPIPYPVDKRVHVLDLDIRSHHQYRYHGLKRLQKFWELNRLFAHRLRDSLDDINPDIVICIRIEFLSQIIKVKGKIPLVCESHSMCKAYKYEKTTFWNRMRLTYSKRYIRKVDCVVALTDGDARDWRCYNSNVKVIPNVVHLNESGVYASLDSKVVIFVGRFSDQKNLGGLLTVWNIVHKRFPDWELQVYGEGEHKEWFIQETKKADINIKVFLPTSHIFEKYLNSSMLIMTSIYEPFGLVLPEAMSCGLPVVAFDCPYGPSSIITDGKDGFLINKNDCESFAEKMELLMNNIKFRRQMGEQAIEPSQRYSSDKIMPVWKELFEELIIR